ncbi:alpha/beta hydrolase family protein [Bacillus sp. UMB0893]|uniref:alpha/beta hydrolase family protein n=1 Tax=Bacillus sp. UMB0893 TaxID=2066053 RepID=UPI000C783FD2|nr:alpha/beta family hydrolase [Bacillus sp. UMB0893]PLR69262.1 alpha/beta hydrolase [Bacillus sp. UMB0893]QNG59271.1 alpha/beta hydrolase [Bacillus sp. PAMC26568]
MIKSKTDSITGFNQAEVPFTLLGTTQQTHNLAIMFPGLGYTTQGPLFHYTTGLFLEKNFDVLHINYQYNSKNYEKFSNEEMDKALKSDVRKVIDAVLSKHEYDAFYLIGKSLGTIALSSELGRTSFTDAKTVWLTPLLNREDVFSTIYRSRQKALCIIGDKDPYFAEENFQKLQGNPNVECVLIPGVNHGLQIEEDSVGSIDVLKNVITEIAQF